MRLHTFILVACVAFHLPHQADAAADIAVVSVAFAGGYSTSTTITGVTIKTTHTQAVTGDIVYTFDSAPFATSGSSQAATCTTSINPSAAHTFTCSVSADGTTLTLTLASGTVAAGTTVIVDVTAPMGTLPSGEGTIALSTVTANSGTDTGFNTAFTFAYMTNAPTISLTSADMNAGTQPTGLSIQIKTSLAIEAGDVSGNTPFAIVANKAIFNSGLSTGITASGATITSGATASTTVATVLFDTTTHAAGIAVDTTFTLTFAASTLATLPNSAGAVTITGGMGNPPDNAMFSGATGFGTIVAASGGGGVGADPVASLGNVRRAFELPLYTLTPLLTSPDLVIHGSVFPGNETEQWFDRVVITTPDESRWMEVKVRKDLEHLNISRVPQWMFSTLDVSLGYGSIAEPVTKTKLHILDEKIPYSFLDQEIVFRKMHRFSNIRFPIVGGIRRECVDMAGTSLHLFLCSAPAHEYYGPLHHLSLRYMHLDLAFIEVRDYVELTGLLPELWGTQPMTEATRAYVKEVTEEKKESPDEEFKKLGGENSTAWVGGLGMEEIREGCLEQNETLLTTV